MEPAIGLEWLSEDRVDYDYGVRPGEARSGRLAYSAGKSALNPFAEISLVYQLDRNWMIVGGVEYVQLDERIVDSPIMDERYQFSAYSAMLYSF